MELKRVGDEVLKHLPHLRSVGLDDRKFVDIDMSAGLLDAHLQVGDGLAGDPSEVDCTERLRARRDP